MVAADLISRVFTIVKIHDHQGQTQNHGTLIMNAKKHFEKIQANDSPKNNELGNYKKNLTFLLNFKIVKSLWLFCWGSVLQ